MERAMLSSEREGAAVKGVSGGGKSDRPGKTRVWLVSVSRNLQQFSQAHRSTPQAGNTARSAVQGSEQKGQECGRGARARYRAVRRRARGYYGARTEPVVVVSSSSQSHDGRASEEHGPRPLVVDRHAAGLGWALLAAFPCCRLSIRRRAPGPEHRH
ncbi:hypothetical protein CC78DRAFT_584036 [Lojkania enalia]|uniref:Uncharacterized protein n=1 Tax=Lojkania enalia TaxID=147567 RepID=A0A9P4K229_9PLEO|nr:hypothetical protein CC78DRAFT_584036 [Didymosphaeria enalia]